MGCLGSLVLTSDLLKDGAEAVPWSLVRIERSVAGRSGDGCFDAVEASEKSIGGAPGGLYDAVEAGGHFLCGFLSEADHVFHLCDTGSGVAPGAGDDVEAFHREEDGGFVGAFVVPVADDHVFRDHVYRSVGIVVAGFPLSYPRGFAVDEPVSPDPHLFAFLRQVVVEGADLAGEELGFVAATAAGAFVFSYVKDFVHAGVEGVGLEDVGQLVYHGEEDVVQSGGEGTVAFTVEVIGIGPDVFAGVGELYPGCFVELWVDLHQFIGRAGPGLVAQQVDLWDDADAVPAAELYHFFYVGPGEGLCICQLGMAGELVAVIYCEDECVDLAGWELLVDEGEEGVQPGWFGGVDTEAADGEEGVEFRPGAGGG